MNNVYEVAADVETITREAVIRLSPHAPKTFCAPCDAGKPLIHDDYGHFHWANGDDLPCANYDTEWVHYLEPLGKPHYAWLPRRCRNGAIRWLVWLEHHKDGTYTQPMEPL